MYSKYVMLSEKFSRIKIFIVNFFLSGSFKNSIKQLKGFFNFFGKDVKILGVWNVNYGTDLVSSMSQSNFTTDTNNNSVAADSAKVSSDYSQILSEKISEIDEQFENMKKNFESQHKNSAKSIETIKRFMPDGSIMITTYEDGKISSRIKKRPHLVPTPDYSAPPTASGEPAIKMQQQLSVADLLMMMI